MRLLLQSLFFCNTSFFSPLLHQSFFQMRVRVVAGDSLMNLLRSTSY
jgi:hypothetical protein